MKVPELDERLRSWADSVPAVTPSEAQCRADAPMIGRQRRVAGRGRWLAVAAAVVVTAGAGLGLLFARDDDQPVISGPDPTLSVPATDSACAPMAGGDPRGPNPILEAGFPSDRIPAVFVEHFTLGGLYCLADELAGRVEAVFVELHDSDGVAAMLLLAHPDVDPNPLASYLVNRFVDTHDAPRHNLEIVSVGPDPHPQPLPHTVIVWRDQQVAQRLGTHVWGSRTEPLASLWEHTNPSR